MDSAGVADVAVLIRFFELLRQLGAAFITIMLNNIKESLHISCKLMFFVKSYGMRRLIP